MYFLKSTVVVAAKRFFIVFYNASADVSLSKKLLSYLK
jgi:hypothetical protein